MSRLVMAAKPHSFPNTSFSFPAVKALTSLEVRRKKHSKVLNGGDLSVGERTLSRAEYEAIFGHFDTTAEADFSGSAPTFSSSGLFKRLKNSLHFTLL